MSKTRKPYLSEYRAEIVRLVRTGRSIGPTPADAVTKPLSLV